MAETHPERLGRYLILGELGRGAMGVVYKAQDSVLDRPVAIKTILLSDDLAEREEYEARFLQEAKAAGRLNHPSIITIYDIGREGDLAYMAMEMLEGIDLRTRMQEGRIPVPDAIDIAEQLADALAFAHERGVVHRDIKPANIMLSHGGRVKIMDFGIARMQISDFKTRTGMLLGTPKYMSPEQVAGRPVDHRSDIFSLGIVLYEMLTRTALFAGKDTTQVINNVANEQPIPPSRLNPEVPSMLDLTVAKALEKDVEARYQDAYEVAVDLRACLRELADSVGQAASEVTRTVRLAVLTDSEAGRRSTGSAAQTEKTMRLVPGGTAIDSSTVLPLSLRFDSSRALGRLAEASAADRVVLSRPPAPQTGWRRIIRDADQRFMALTIAGGAFAALLIAAA